MTEGLFQRISRAEARFEAEFPGDGGRRQPAHVVYGGAHLFKPDTAQKLGGLALKALETWAPDDTTLGEALGISSSLAALVRPRLVAKLEREPVEDLRVDFEDGYGPRPEAEEDEHAAAAGRAWAVARAQGTLPAFSGLRIKALTRPLALRAMATLKLFLSNAEVDAHRGQGLLVTLPKVSSAEQLAVLLDGLDGMGATEAKVEVMIELPQALSQLGELQKVGGARLHAVHLGLYDFLSALDVTAASQRFQHPLCDEARARTRLAFAGTRVFVSDGATTVFPVPRHRGASLSAQQVDENRAGVLSAWRQHSSDVRHSLRFGLYQGWDLHPAQLVSRFGTLTAFFLENLGDMTARLKHFVEQYGQATLSGAVFDDAATGLGLLAFFARGRACGALTEAEVAATGVTNDVLATRSFASLAARRSP